MISCDDTPIKYRFSIGYDIATMRYVAAGSSELPPLAAPSWNPRRSALHIQARPGRRVSDEAENWPSLENNRIRRQLPRTDLQDSAAQRHPSGNKRRKEEIMCYSRKSKWSTLSDSLKSGTYVSAVSKTEPNRGGSDKLRVGRSAPSRRVSTSRPHRRFGAGSWNAGSDVTETVVAR